MSTWLPSGTEKSQYCHSERVSEESYPQCDSHEILRLPPQDDVVVNQHQV